MSHLVSIQNFSIHDSSHILIVAEAPERSESVTVEKLHTMVKGQGSLPPPVSRMSIDHVLASEQISDCEILKKRTAISTPHCSRSWKIITVLEIP